MTRRLFPTPCRLPIPRGILATLFLVMISGAAASAQVPQSSVIPGMDKQCILNHPFRADLTMAMVMAPTADSKTVDTKVGSTEVGVPGEILRDSEGRQKIVMTMTMPGGKEPVTMVMLLEPPEGKLRVIFPSMKMMTTQEMPQVHCAPTVTEPDFSEVTKQGGVVTSLGTKDFGELRATGYKISMDVPQKGTEPHHVDMELWADLTELIPVSLSAKSGDMFSMDMRFTNVKLIEPSPDEFKLPDGYKEMKAPEPSGGAAVPDGKAAVPAPETKSPN